MLENVYEGADYLPSFNLLSFVLCAWKLTRNEESAVSCEQINGGRRSSLLDVGGPDLVAASQRGHYSSLRRFASCTPRHRQPLEGLLQEKLFSPVNTC